MSLARWMPIAGLLALLAVVPGALAHHCNGGDTSTSDFNTQTTTAASFSSVALAAIVLVPLLVIGTVLAAVRASAKPVGGTWVATPTQWVFVPKQK